MPICIKCDLIEKGRRDEKFLASIKVVSVPNRGDELKLESSDFNISGDYTVLGVKHHVSEDVREHRVDLYVRKG